MHIADPDASKRASMHPSTDRTGARQRRTSDPACRSDILRVYARFMLDVACHCTNLRRAARALTGLYDSALEPIGLRVTQYSLLRAIVRLDRPSITRLAAATGLDRSTLGRNLRLLVKQGLVTLGAGADERTRIVGLTAAGEAVLEAALPRWQAAQLLVDEELGAAGKAALKAMTARLQRLGADADGGDR